MDFADFSPAAPSQAGRATSKFLSVENPGQNWWELVFFDCQLVGKKIKAQPNSNV